MPYQMGDHSRPPWRAARISAGVIVSPRRAQIGGGAPTPSAIVGVCPLELLPPVYLNLAQNNPLPLPARPEMGACHWAVSHVSNSSRVQGTHRPGPARALSNTAPHIDEGRPELPLRPLAVDNHTRDISPRFSFCSPPPPYGGIEAERGHRGEAPGICRSHVQPPVSH